MVIRPTRIELSRSFPVLGFAVHSDQQPRWFEIAIATEKRLFAGSEKLQRSESNFFSTRAQGPLTFANGEALYLVPPEVLSRFAGRDSLYYALASYEEPTLDKPSAVFVPNGSPQSVRISKSFTGVSRRLTTRSTTYHRDYAGSDPKTISWGGDAFAATPAAAANHPQARPTASALDTAYDDGHGPMSTPVMHALPALATATADDQYGIDGPVPDRYDLLAVGMTTGAAVALDDAAVDAGAPTDAAVGAAAQVKVSTLKVWLNAFIPEASVTALGDCFSGDNRAFSSDIHASSRMHSEVEAANLGASAAGESFHWHNCDTSHKIDCSTGAVLEEARGDTSRMTFRVNIGSFPDPVAGVHDLPTPSSVRIAYVGAANNPLVSHSPDIDMNMVFTLDPVTGILNFEGAVDAFPSFEGYASANNGAPVELFTHSHAPDAGPTDLIGDANQPISGSVQLG